jgi:biopolymer transport protein ExbB/TolQ
MSPLVGLFGTATGISNAFVTLTMLKTDITQTALVKRLAGGIFEALWTTIEGLLAGIILMMLYYYYQNKLNWIYSKWEEIYVQVSERL